MNIWYEDIYKYLLKIKEITDTYKNPLINDSGGASICNDIDNVPKYWKLMLYKPDNIEHVNKGNIHLCKWLVNESYHDFVSNDDNDDSNDDTDYEYYEWNFNKHCIKLD